MFGYKGFNKDFQCINGFQYEVGKTYELEDDIQVCHRGFHFCDNPLEVLKYYPPNTSRYAIVKAIGDIQHDAWWNGKHCTDKITIVREITPEELVEIPGKAYLKKTVEYSHSDYSSAMSKGDLGIAISTGCQSIVCSQGYRSIAGNTDTESLIKNTGYKGIAVASNNNSKVEITNKNGVGVATGYKSMVETSGESSIAISIGEYGKAKGKVGTWIILAEWVLDSPISVQVFLVDDDKVKADTWYCLKNGKLCECE